MTITASATFTQSTGLNDGTITLTVSGGTGSFGFSWSLYGKTFSSSKNLTSLYPGTYICNVISGLESTQVAVVLTATAGNEETLLQSNRFDNSLTGTGTLGFTPTATGTVSYAAFTPVTGKNALQIPSGGNTVFYPFDTTLDYKTNNPWAFGGWFNVQSATTSRCFLFSNYAIDVISRTNGTTFELWNIGVQLSIAGASFPTPAQGAWFHIWITFDKTHFNIYYNGTFLCTGDPQYLNSNNTPWRLGGSAQYNTAYATMQVADIRFYKNYVPVEKAINYYSLNNTMVVTGATTNNATSGATNGTITTTVTGGTAPLSYSWSNSATTASLTNLASNTYTVTVTDSSATPQISKASFVIFSQLTAVASSTVNATTGVNGSISITLVNATAPSFAWTVDGFSAVISTNQNLSNIPKGVYTCTISCSDGQTTTVSATITGVNPTPVWTNKQIGSDIAYKGNNCLDVSDLVQSTSTYPLVVCPALRYTSSWTIEAWVYPITNSNSTYWQVSEAKQANTNCFYVASNLFYNFRGNSGAVAVTGTDRNLGAWNHIASCFDASTNKYYYAVNGTVASSTQSGSPTISMGKAINLLWRDDTGGAYDVACLDSMRVTQSCLYTTTYTVPDPTTWTVTPTTLLLETFESALTFTKATVTNTSTTGGTDGTIGATVITGATGSLSIRWTSSSGSTTISSTDATAKTSLKAGLYTLSATDGTNTGSIVYRVSEPLTLTAVTTNSTSTFNDGAITLTVTGGMYNMASTLAYSWVPSASTTTVISTSKNLTSLIPGIYTCTVTSGSSTRGYLSAKITKTVAGPTSSMLAHLNFQNDVNIGGSLKSTVQPVTVNTTMNGAPTFANGPLPGMASVSINNNVSYSVSTAYLQMGYNSALDFTNTSTFSFGGWFYLMPNSSYQRVLMSNTNATTGTNGIELCPQVFHSSLNATVYKSNAGTTISSSAWNEATWTHYWVTYNGTTLSLYRNGVMEGSVALGAGAFASGSPWLIGKSLKTPTNSIGPANWQGLMSDIRFYSGLYSPLYAMTPIVYFTLGYSLVPATTAVSNDAQLTAVPTNVVGSSSTYTYNWSNGSTTATASNLSATKYTLTVIDAAGNSVTGSAYGIVPLSFTSFSGVNCTTINNGSVTAVMSGIITSAPYVYSWTRNGKTLQGHNTLSLPSVFGGTYSLTVSAYNYSISSSNVTLTSPYAIVDFANGASVASFNGTTQYGQSVSTVTLGGAMTVQCWINPTLNSDNIRVFSFHNGQGTDVFSLYFQNQGYGPAFVVNVNGNVQNLNNTANFATNSWTHVAFVLQSNGFYNIYINGNNSQGGYVGTLPSKARSLYWGKSDTASDPLFKGSMLDLRVYNTNRTQTQINTDMKFQLQGTEANLVVNFDSTSISNASGQIITSARTTPVITMTMIGAFSKLDTTATFISLTTALLAANKTGTPTALSLFSCNGNLNDSGSLGLNITNYTSTLGGAASYVNGPQTATKALVIPTQSSYIQLPFSTKLDLQTSPFSIGGYFNVSSYTGVVSLFSNLATAGGGRTSYTFGEYLKIVNSCSSPYGGITGNYGVVTSDTDSSTAYQGTILNTFRHFWLICTGAGGTVTMYIDGLPWKSVAVNSGSYRRDYGGQQQWQVGSQPANAVATGGWTGACSNLRIYNAIVDPLLTLSLGATITATATDAFSYNSATGTATATVVSGSGPFTYLWSNGARTATVSNLLANTYTVTVTDGNGSTSSSSVTVGQPLFVTISNTSSSGTNGTASVTAVGGSGIFTYTWVLNGTVSVPQTTATITDLAPGLYTCTVKSSSYTSVVSTAVSSLLTVVVTPTTAQFSYAPITNATYQVTYSVPPSSTQSINLANTSLTTVTIASLTPSTTYTFYVYSIVGGVKTLQYSAQVTTSAPILANVSKASYSAPTLSGSAFYNLANVVQVGTSTPEAIIQSQFTTGDKGLITNYNNATANKIVATVLKTNSTLTIKKNTNIVIPFDPVVAMAQSTTLVTSTGASVPVTYNNSANSITVAGTLYNVGDTFILDGQLVTVSSTT